MTEPRLGHFGELMPIRGFSRVKRLLPEQQVAWITHDRLLVVSSIVNTELPGSGEPPLIGPTWHLSASRPGTQAEARCTVTDEDLLRVADCFALPAFDEDNHHPGIARHLFCPLEEEYRSACECKVAEQLIVEPGGYRWTTETGECRGCEYERMYGLPCTIHRP